MKLSPVPLRAAFAAASTLGSNGIIQPELAKTSQQVSFVALAIV
jgi:hypothetical protein